MIEQLAGDEPGEHDDDEQGRRRDDPARALQPDHDGVVVGVAALVQLDDPGQQEHLVVHGQPEPEGQQPATGSSTRSPRPSRTRAGPRRWPCWKTSTTIPSEAPSDTTLSISALTGMTTDPVMRKSRTSVASATRPKAIRRALEHRVGEVAQAGGLSDDVGREVRAVRRAAASTRSRAGSSSGRPGTSIAHERQVVGHGPDRRASTLAPSGSRRPAAYAWTCWSGASATTVDVRPAEQRVVLGEAVEERPARGRTAAAARTRTT